MSTASKGISKILQGVLRYNKTVKGELVPYFREILDKPSPKSIMVSCIDSRVIASRILQAEPGAYFLVRSPGNFIPKYESLENSIPGCTAAAIELACVVNKANTIGVIGHSDCKTLNLLFDMKDNLDDPKHEKSELKAWLKANGLDTIEKYRELEQSGFKKMLTFSRFNENKFDAYIDPENKFNVKDKFSQINTLEQLKNINNVNFLKDRLKEKDLRGYALWIDVVTSDVYMFSYEQKRFIKIDETTYEDLYKECALP